MTERDLKKGIFIAGVFIVVCYVVGFLMVVAALSWNEFPEGVSSLSALFVFFIFLNIYDPVAVLLSTTFGVMFNFKTIGNLVFLRFTS